MFDAGTTPEDAGLVSLRDLTEADLDWVAQREIEIDRLDEHAQLGRHAERDRELERCVVVDDIRRVGRRLREWPRHRRPEERREDLAHRGDLGGRECTGSLGEAVDEVQAMAAKRCRRCGDCDGVLRVGRPVLQSERLLGHAFTLSKYGLSELGIA